MAKEKTNKLSSENPSSNDPDPTFTVGTSLNRPINEPVKSIFYEKDTGNRLRYLGNGQWEFIDNLHN